MGEHSSRNPLNSSKKRTKGEKEKSFEMNIF
jgi:hypothetical protein